MRRTSSLPRRITRMEGQRTNRQWEETIIILAEEFGFDPGAVRCELAEIVRRIRQYGPESPAAGIQRLAAAFALDPADLRTEVVQIQDRLRARGVVW